MRNQISEVLHSSETLCNLIQIHINTLFLLNWDHCWPTFAIIVMDVNKKIENQIIVKPSTERVNGKNQPIFNFGGRPQNRKSPGKYRKGKQELSLNNEISDG